MDSALKIGKVTLKGVNTPVFQQKFECEFQGGSTEIIGLNASGKSTLINAIRTVRDGISSKHERFKFIAPDKRSADVEVVIIDEANNNAEIILKRHLTASANNKLVFEAPKDYPVALDDEWLNKLFSEAFLSASHFTQYNKKQQAILLGIDTEEYDEKLKILKAQYTVLNREAKNHPKPEEIEEVQTVDIETLQKKKTELKAASDEQYKRNQAHNSKLRRQHEEAKEKARQEAAEFMSTQSDFAEQRQITTEALETLIEYGYKGDEVQNWIDTLPKPQPPKEPEIIPDPEYIQELPDTSELDALDQQIQDAYSTNQKAAEYQRFLDSWKVYEAKQAAVEANKAKQEEAQKARLDYIKAADLPFSGLEIDEQGGLLYQGKEIRPPLFSTAQLTMIVAQLRSKLDINLNTVFIDDADLLDEENEPKLINWLLEKGFQVILAKVGRSKLADNKIVLSPIEEEPADNKEEIVV